MSGPIEQAEQRLAWQRARAVSRRPELRRFTVPWLLDGPGWTLLRLGVDIVMLVLAMLSAVLGAHAAHVPAVDRGLLIAFPILCVFLLWVRGMYRRRLRIIIAEGVVPLVGAVSIAAMA